jgi:hypothetical protein
VSRPALATSDLLAAATCTAVALLHQPRPAIAALASYPAFRLAARRRGLALIACLAIALGLIATSPPHHPAPARTNHGRAAR